MTVEMTAEQWERAASNAEAVALTIVKDESAVMQSERVDHHIVATAALLRCRALLLGMVALARTQRREIIGFLGRALFESWVYSTVALHGDADDVQRLAADTQRRRTRRRQKLGEHTVLNPAHKALTERERFDRARELLAERGEAAGMDDWYDLYYGGDSLFVAHTNLDSLDRYIIAGDDGDITSLDADPEPDGADFGRFIIATAMTALLAKASGRRRIAIRPCSTASSTTSFLATAPVRSRERLVDRGG